MNMDREEIIAKVQRLTGIFTDDVTTLCQDWLDHIQDDITRRYDFPFLTGFTEIATTPTYETGTIDVTNASTAITGTGTSFASTMVGSYLKASGSAEYYQIASVESTTELTLTTNYLGDTDTALEYAIHKLFYDLPADFGKMKWAKQMVSARRLVPIPDFVFTDIVPNEFDSSGEVSGYILSGQSSAGRQQIRFYPLQTSSKLIYISYKKKLSTINTEGAESVIPSDWHQAFVFKLAEYVYEANDLDFKANKMAAIFEVEMAKMIKENKEMLRDMSYQMKEEDLGYATEKPRLPDDYEY